MNQLHRAISGKFSPYPHRGGRRRDRSRFSGDPMIAAQQLNTPVQSINAPLGPVRLLNTGNKSPFNPNAPLHHNLVTLKLKNNDPTNPADIVLTPGRHNFQPPKATAGTSLSDQEIADGANALVNNAGDNVSVTATCEYGFRSNAGSAWAEIKALAKDYGLIVNAMRVDFLTQDQMRNSIVFQKYEVFGQDAFDKIVPANYYNPAQYHDKTMLVPETFVMNQDFIIYYTIDPAETVTFFFYIGGILDVQNAVLQYARQMNAYSV